MFGIEYINNFFFFYDELINQHHVCFLINVAIVKIAKDKLLKHLSFDDISIYILVRDRPQIFFRFSLNYIHYANC